MTFHQGFSKGKLDICASPDWFSQRAKLYAETAKWDEKEVDEVYFHFSEPTCGWIDISIYCNDKKVHTFPISQAFDPFPALKVWMEDIVCDYKLSSDLYIEAEGRTIILHYEHIKLAEVGICRKYINEDRDKDEWESFDANSHPGTGLFYIYDSEVDEMPVVCYCETKQLLFTLYNGLLYYASRSKSAPKIGKEWYYMSSDEDSLYKTGNWHLYNVIKSPLIEWNYDSKEAYRHEYPCFKQTPQIKETVHMWFEWGDGLFWHQRGGCCGDAEGFFVDSSAKRIDLYELPEIRKWYNEFDESGPFGVDSWTKEHMDSWFRQGWELAKKVRVLLPDSVDLFYQWKSFKVESSEWRAEEVPLLVPDTRLIINKDNNE